MPTLTEYTTSRKPWWPGDQGRCLTQRVELDRDGEAVDQCHGLEGHAGAHWFPYMDHGRKRPFTWPRDLPHVKAGNWPDV